MESKTSGPVNAEQSGPKPHYKLGPSGAAILEEYWSKHASPTLPPLCDRRELTARIKELPGYADFWNDQKTTDWCRRRCRKLSSAQLQAGAVNVIQIQNADALQDTVKLLDVLLRDQPNPSSDVIQAWATILARIAGNSMTVEEWVVFLQRLISSKSVAEPDKSAGTVQSDPSIGSMCGEVPTSAVSFDKVKHDPVDSPVLHPMSFEAQVVPEAFRAEKPQSSAFITRSTPSTGETPVSLSKHATTLQAVVEDVLEAFPDAPDCSILPTNPDEFEAMFAPYEQKLTRLLCLLESEQ